MPCIFARESHGSSSDFFIFCSIENVVQSARLFRDTGGFAMKCDVCGQEYGLSHNCPGAPSSAALDIASAGMEPPANAGLFYYLGEAVKIVRWDDLAVRRNSKDRRALYYGILFWSCSAFLVLSISILLQVLPRFRGKDPIALLFGLIVGIVFAFCLIAVWTFLQLGLCHLIAKWFLGATGKFIEVLRPLLLGWFVNCLAIVPVAGTLLAGIGWTAVLMIVFEEVDGIGRLQAFVISAGINVCFLFLQSALMPRHF